MSAIDKSKIMQEIDRLYWKNETSEGRINCIADYVINELKELESLRARVAELEGERQKISDYIKVKTESGEVPDNLADHVQLLMLQEYDPMMKTIQIQREKIAELEDMIAERVRFEKRNDALT